MPTLPTSNAAFPAGLRNLPRIAAILAAVSLLFPLWSPAAPVRPTPSLVGHAAPLFMRAGLDGRPIALAHYRGKVVLLNFWATWCAPCRVEMPRFVEWQQRFGPQGLQVLGVSIDDDDSEVKPFVRNLHGNYPVMMGDARLGRLYGGVLGVPITFLIDRHGIVRDRLEGEQNLDKLEQKIQQLLKQ